MCPLLREFFFYISGCLCWFPDRGWLRYLRILTYVHSPVSISKTHLHIIDSHIPLLRDHCTWPGSNYMFTFVTWIYIVCSGKLCLFKSQEGIGSPTHGATLKGRKLVVFNRKFCPGGFSSSCV